MSSGSICDRWGIPPTEALILAQTPHRPRPPMSTSTTWSMRDRGSRSTTPPRHGTCEISQTPGKPYIQVGNVLARLLPSIAVPARLFKEFPMSSLSFPVPKVLSVVHAGRHALNCMPIAEGCLLRLVSPCRPSSSSCHLVSTANTCSASKHMQLGSRKTYKGGGGGWLRPSQTQRLLPGQPLSVLRVALARPPLGPVL